MAPRREERDEAPADVAAGTDDEDPHDTSLELGQEPVDHGSGLVGPLQLGEIADVLDRDPFQVAFAATSASAAAGSVKRG